MKTKIAILQVADVGPLDSLVQMLQSIGITCTLPSRAVKDAMRSIGCDTVLDIADLVRSGSYDPPFYKLQEAGLADLNRSDTILVDIKAHRSYAKIVAKWPALTNRVLWYRINGGMPEHVINDRGDHGDELNPPCPVLTPNQWYAGNVSAYDAPKCSRDGRAYACWPPFVAIGDYVPSYRDGYGHFDRPFCLVHNLAGWGYGALADKFRDLGIALHGERSPDGLLHHREVPTRLSKALAYVHLKSSDAPGYALYEALAAGCPVICTRRLIWRCRMQSLLIPGETCLVFDRETHDGLTVEDTVQCEQEVRGHLKALTDLAYNRRIGTAGRAQLEKVMWSKDRPDDVASLQAFIERHYK